MISHTSLDFLCEKSINLNSVLADFVINSSWAFPPSWQIWFPSMLASILDLPLSSNGNCDFLVWNRTVFGSLSLKDAYSFKYKPLLVFFGPTLFGAMIFPLIRLCSCGDY